ncbi:hypothetical protein FNF27_01315 [Cafeteria roenbergensis]|uniref:Uncharacterized protein n=1 Tax=Cafeteria roenbergensis TaxID=33653 RepID=A0A5A8EGG3_CAFRO|nr:hypothetical protein FNF27_01315 [Cafeteria roenbergensis]
MPALDGLAAGPASRLGLREDERSAWVGLVRRLAAHPDLLSAAEMLKDDTVMASRARARLGEMVCTDPGVAWRAEAFAGVAAEWVRDLGPALPGLRWEGVVGVPDADALDAAALRANGDTAQLVGITARCLGELDCWTRDEERHGLHAVAQRSEEAYWALANNPSRDAAAAIRKAVLGTGGARERDRLLRQCLVELGDVHPHPFRALGCAVAAASDAWRAELGSRSAAGAEHSECLDRNDDVGICAGMAAAVSLASVALALATVCRRTRDAGDGASLASLAGMGIRLRPWFSAALLAAQALCFACLSGMLLECWGSTVLGQQRAGPDLSLVHELDCGGWWMEWLRTGACVWIVMFAVFAVALAALSLPTQGGTLCCGTISQANAMELIGLAIAVGSVVLSQLPRLMAVDLSRHEGDSSDFEAFCLLPTLLAGGGWCLGFGVLSPSIDILVSWGWMGDATKWGAGRRGFVSAHVARDALRRITSGAPRRHVRTAAVAASHATLPGAAD